MIIGFHSLVYSDDADATRAFFRDVLEWPSLDAGDGWLIFKTPPSEMGVHPMSQEYSGEADGLPLHQISLMCDDVSATASELRAKGVEVRDEIVDEGFGLVTMIKVPGAGWLQLYQPRHPQAHRLDP